MSSHRVVVVEHHSPRSYTTNGSSRHSSETGYDSAGGYYSSRSGQDRPRARDPPSGSRYEGYSGASNTREQNPRYDTARTPFATGTRHSISGGPRENPYGYEKVTREHKSGRTVETHNYGVQRDRLPDARKW
ncbi:MAG: hypothetical protein M1833_005671 [Piccolia ochrophora]|nr:MAG: hypothetical protein M1833_005671 [Piccolia ochrophora]